MQPHIRPKLFDADTHFGRAETPRTGQTPARLSNSAVSAFCCTSDSCSPTGVPVELGTRAFDLLLALLEADGSLVTKEALMSRVWPRVVVSEENLKHQVSVLRKALGA